MHGPAPRSRVVRVFDTTFGFLLRPHVRRVRRWSFLVTVPAGVLVARELRIDPGEGLLAGAAIAALEALLFVCVLAAGGRLLGRERRDALLDLLMHPVVRRAVVGEARMLATFPRLLWHRVRLPPGDAFSYHRGSNELGLAIALLPAALAEGAAVHLLLPDGWVWPQVVLAVLHVYAMLMLLAWAVGERTEPHRLHDGVLHVRAGQLLRADVPLADIARIELQTRREGQRTGFIRDVVPQSARLAVGGRTDVVLHLRRPVLVERPLADPAAVTLLSIRVDEAARLAHAVQAHRRSPVERRHDGRLLAWLAPGELLDAAAG